MNDARITSVPWQTRRAIIFIKISLINVPSTRHAGCGRWEVRHSAEILLLIHDNLNVSSKELSLDRFLSTTISLLSMHIALYFLHLSRAHEKIFNTIFTTSVKLWVKAWGFQWLGCGRRHVWYKITQFHSGHLVNINGSGVMSMEGSSTNHMLSRGGASIAPSIYISFHITVALENICKVCVHQNFYLGHWQWLIVV